MHLHQLHQINQRLSAHHAVRVEANEVAIAPPPRVEKVTHVAALLVLVDHAATIINPPERIQIAHQFRPTPLFFDPLLRISRITQDKKVKPLKLSSFLQRLIGGAQSFQHTHHILIVDWEHQRSASPGNILTTIFLEPRNVGFLTESSQKKTKNAVRATHRRQEK